MARPPPDAIYTMRAHTGPVTSLDFVEEDSVCKWGPETPFPWLLSGSAKGEIFLWNLKTFRVENKLPGHDGKGIVWLGHYNDCILSLGRDGILKLWKYENEEWKTVSSHSELSAGFCQCSLINENSSARIAVCSQDMIGTCIIDIESGKEISKVKPDEDDVKSGMCMCLKLVSRENFENLLICGYENGHVIAWDYHNQKAVSHLCHKETVMCLDFDEEHRLQGISGSADDILNVWNLSTQLKLTEKKQITLTNPGVGSVAIRPDGKVVVSGGWDGRLRYFSWASLRPLAVLLNHNETIQCLKFSCGRIGRYAQLLAAGSKDSKISLWNLYS